MASSAVATLARKPLGTQLAVLGGILAVLGFLYWNFFYSDMQEERRGAVARKASIAKKLDELRKDAKELEALRRERADRKLKIEKGLLKLPAKAELPAFLRQLQNQAGAAGVKLKSYAQQKEQPVEDFVKVPYRIEAAGTFHQLTRYFWLLWEYSKSDSGLIITIEDLSLSGAAVGPDGLVLTAKFTASTFRQADAGDDAVQAVPAAAPADDKKPPAAAVQPPVGATPAGTGAAPAGGGGAAPAGGASAEGQR
jgi:Tfp pilus assembly protein PilO